MRLWILVHFVLSMFKVSYSQISASGRPKTLHQEITLAGQTHPKATSIYILGQYRTAAYQAPSSDMYITMHFLWPCTQGEQLFQNNSSMAWSEIKLLIIAPTRNYCPSYKHLILMFCVVIFYGHYLCYRRTNLDH